MSYIETNDLAEVRLMLYGIPEEIMDVIVLRPQGSTLKPQASEKQKEIFNNWQKKMKDREKIV